MKRVIYLAIIATALMSCQNIIEETGFSQDPKVFDAEMEIFEGLTKTSMDGFRNVIWSYGDQISIFQGCSHADKYQVTSESAGSTNGTFRIIRTGTGGLDDDFVSGTEIGTNVAFYPYTENISANSSSASEDYSLATYSVNGYELPEIQKYAYGSFGEGSFPMIAITEDMADHTLRFKNITGAIRLQLTGSSTVSAITIEGACKEKLSGPAVITVGQADKIPVITMSPDAVTRVTLECSDGVVLSEDYPTSFIISLPPVSFTDGFTVTITDSEGHTYNLTTTESNTIRRSAIHVMPPVRLEKISEEEEEEDAVRFTDPEAAAAAGATLEHLTSGELYDKYEDGGAPVYHLTYTQTDTPLRITIPAEVNQFNSNPWSYKEYLRVNDMTYDEYWGPNSILGEVVKDSENSVYIHMDLPEGSDYLRGNINFTNNKNYGIIMTLICTIDLRTE
jgi:hypothetical protein